MYPVPRESRIAVREDEVEFRKAVGAFDRQAIADGKSRWLEKTPRHILHIGKILEWLPNAKIIIITRDGRDVAYSIKQRSGSLDTGVKRWCEENLAGKEYWSNPNVYLIKYEQLISDFEIAITGVLSFLGEEYDDGIKEFYKIPKRWFSKVISKPPIPFGRNHEQYRNWQINQPLFDGRGRWKEMSADELSYVEETAGSLLVELGYANRSDATKEEMGGGNL
jgi:Sulfotransferase family